METDTYIVESPATTETPTAEGDLMVNFISRLFPLCRSITGNGVRKTLDIVSEIIPLDRYEIPTGTQVFDWVVPKEWNIREAWIKNSNGEKIIDFADNNLHILNYCRSEEHTSE